MLDNPAERRFFLIKNGADGKAQQQVASVVERTTRFGFFKITVPQGIVIDPRHPDQATVFALLVNPKELGRLRDQLKEVLPGHDRRDARRSRDRHAARGYRPGPGVRPGGTGRCVDLA